MKAGGQPLGPTSMPPALYTPFGGPHRSICGLKLAVPLAARPSCIPNSKPSSLSSSKQAGLRLEKQLQAALPGSIRGQWFSYQDDNGPGVCQPDLLYPFLPYFLCVIEIKYTLVPGAHQKLNSLYIPVVQAALRKPCAGVVIVKNLDPRYRRGRIYTDLKAAADAAFDRGFPTLVQWSGQALLRAA